MVEPEGGWTKAAWKALADEADVGRRGEGAVVEAMRRVAASSTKLGWIMIGLALVQALAAALTIAQWIKR